MLKKKVVSLALVVACILSLQMSAFAAKKTTEESESVSNQVYSQIEASVLIDADTEVGTEEPTDEQYALIEARVETANRQIEHWVWVAQKTPKNDIDHLLAQVDRVVVNVTRQAANYGIEIGCEYTEHEIDGQTVLIDPLRVINRR